MGLVVLLLINPESAHPSMLPGVRVHDVNKRIDERGFFAEIVRNDWKDFLDDIASEEKLQLVRVPGHYWHGTMTLGVQPSLTLYFVSRLYDAKDPDEDRRAWNDQSILDPKTSKPFDWNRPPHK